MAGEETRYGIPYALLADAPDEEAISKALAEKIASVDLGAHGSFLREGVVTREDFEFTANVNSATGELGSTGAIGHARAFLTDPVVANALMYVNGPTGTIAKKPLSSGALPAAGKFAAVVFELQAVKWKEPATLTTSAGVEKATQAEAEAAIPVAQAKRMIIRWLILRNNAGVYEIVKQQDTREGSGLIYGPNLSPTPNAKLQASGGFGARTEAAGRILRLEGNLEVKAGETFAKGEVLLELVRSMNLQALLAQKIAMGVILAATGATEVSVFEWGGSQEIPKLTLLSPSLTAGKQVCLDGITIKLRNS